MLIDRLNECTRNQRAILAVNFYNSETLLGVLRAAKQSGQSIMLQTSPSTLKYLGIHQAAAMARGAAADIGVEAFLHLDHAHDEAMIRQCIDLGYDSVMYDGSENSFADNIAGTCRIVEYAHAKGVLVEAELGYIPKLGQAEASESGYTDPDQALEFIDKTKIDLLAVACGTAHGFYKSAPKLDYALVEKIRQSTSLPLVLHGSSGLSAGQLQEVIKSGINKINLATEVKNIFSKTLKDIFATSEEIDMRKTFPPAIDAVTTLVAEKLQIIAGK